mmetsp:Transcript_58097/g.101701  ORF Transcript_58097/g.101701 Transcript_58097/m.101701 type:complete len:407 (-) Transcript_58097:187-1407(-)
MESSIQVATIKPGCAFSCGLLADIQYADVDDAKGRHYRATLQVLEQAVDFFNQYDLAFVAHLGDIVDYRNSRMDRDGTASRAALQEVFRRFGGLRILADEVGVMSKTALEAQKLVCILGNHELYNFARTGPELTNPPFAKDQQNYYTFCPAAGWRVVVLDPYDFSMMSNGRNMRRGGHYTNPDALRYAEEQYQYILEVAQTKGQAVPPEADRFMSNSGAHDFNGAVGEAQLKWLYDTLKTATLANERVLLFCHVLIHPPQKRGNYQNLLWNYAEVLNMIHSPECCCVVACLHGHTHHGSLFKDVAGIYHIAFESPMFAETGEGRQYQGPWAILESYEDCLVLRGRGNSGSPVFGDALMDDKGSCIVTLPLRPFLLDHVPSPSRPCDRLGRSHAAPTHADAISLNAA